MSKFCENCGAEMNDNDVVCAHCGPQAEPVVENTVNETSASANSNNTKNIAIIGGIAAAVVILLVIIIIYNFP